MCKTGALVYAQQGMGHLVRTAYPPSLSPICEDGTGMGRHVGDVTPPSCALFLAPPTHPHSQTECGGSGAPVPWGTRFVRAPSSQTKSPSNEGWGLHVSPSPCVSPPVPPTLPVCLHANQDDATGRGMHSCGARSGRIARKRGVTHAPLLGVVPTPARSPFRPGAALSAPGAWTGEVHVNRAGGLARALPIHAQERTRPRLLRFSHLTVLTLWTIIGTVIFTSSSPPITHRL
jgi:hypothetical protein